MPARDEVFDESLGRALKVLRTERGVDRRELADQAGISYSYLAEIENGTKPASSRVLRAVAEALGVNLHQLLGYAEHLAAAGPPAAETARLPRAAVTAPAHPLSPPPTPGHWFHASAAPSDGDSDHDPQVDQLERLIGELSPDDRRMVLILVRHLIARG